MATTCLWHRLKMPVTEVPLGTSVPLLRQIFCPASLPLTFSASQVSLEGGVTLYLVDAKGNSDWLLDPPAFQEPLEPSVCQTLPITFGGLASSDMSPRLKPGKTFMRQMFELFKGTTKNKRWVRLNMGFKSVVVHAHGSMEQWNGVAMMPDPAKAELPPPPPPRLYSDASG